MTDFAGTRQLSDTVRPRAAEHLRQFHDEVRRRFPNKIAQVVLFGSRARGDARRGSDYDVAVFVRGLSDRRSVDHALADIAYPHILAGVHIRPVSLSAAYLKAPQESGLSLSIAHEGVEVTDGEG